MNTATRTVDPRGRVDILILRLAEVAGKRLVQLGQLHHEEWRIIRPFVKNFLADTFRRRHRRCRPRRYRNEQQ